jgi:hypothetical protein
MGDCNDINFIVTTSVQAIVVNNTLVRDTYNQPSCAGDITHDEFEIGRCDLIDPESPEPVYRRAEVYTAELGADTTTSATESATATDRC